MNGIERITARIEAQAQEELDAILSAAKAEAEAVEEEYRLKAQALRTQLAAQAEKAAAEKEERLVSAARMEGRKTMLSARQELVDTAYLTAQAKLCLLPHDKAVEVLSGLMERSSVTGDEEVIFSPADRERVGQEAVEKANAKGKRLVLSEETRALRGGFILRRGRVEINCAFETLIRLEKGRSAAQTAKLLFE